MKYTAGAALILGVCALSGCANTDMYSGNVFSGQDAKMVQNVSYGTIISVRPVRIQDDQQQGSSLGGLGGAVIGGLLGSEVGGGIGRDIATTAGAIAGSVVGSNVGNRLDQTEGLEMVIRKSNGQNIVVVQQAAPGFVPGARVQLVGNGGQATVSLIGAGYPYGYAQ
ncbi:MAG: glycine zipper 2TM domain-containing protein [Plesiomonas sp.]|uniref:glycine zipper 2TM domain-containing protein n=1 Tax=Plesiomonas sp. TaxID=2486279 RepID=UPI003F30685D